MTKTVKTGSKYSDIDRRRAVVEYCTHGVMSRVSKLTGIPDTTLAHWKNKSDWWYDMVAEVRNEINQAILAQNLQIALRAGELVLDSLENGDEKLVWDRNKKGYVIKRVKPSGKDAAVIGGIAQDKARVQLNMPTSITDNRDSKQRIQEQVVFFTDLSNRYYAKHARSIEGKCEEIE